MWEKIKELLARISEVNFTSPRACLTAYLRSLDSCDINEDGKINSKELLKLYKDTTIHTVVTYEMTDEEIHACVESLLKRM